MSSAIRNRIKAHRRVRAGDLVPHELNFRTHPELQQAALRATYEEIGFARSLLAFELPDGRLKLIDGHLRRDIDPDMEVDVEMLDVSEEEARALLLTIDPVGVDPGCLQALVSKQHLNRSQIDAALAEVGGKAMPQRVAAGAAREAGAPPCLGHGPRQRPDVNVMPGNRSRNKKGRRVLDKGKPVWSLEVWIKPAAPLLGSASRARARTAFALDSTFASWDNILRCRMRP